MLDYARRIVGAVKVEERNGIITIGGFNTQALSEDIRKVWRTSKIINNMLIKQGGAGISLPSFFAIELRFILNELINSRRTLSSKRVMSNIIEELETNTWLVKLNQEVKPWFNHGLADAFVFPLLDHQIKFLQHYEATKAKYGLKGMLLFAAPGSGKTITDIAVTLGVEANKVIIISPANALHKVWEHTLKEEMKEPQYPYLSDTHGESLDPYRKYHVFSYERIDYALKLIKQFKSTDKVAIVLDECHNFNRLEALRTERFIQLCAFSNVSDVIWASGTPIKALGIESIPLLRTIDPLFTNDVETAFKKMYGRDAVKTLDILSHRLGIVSYVVPKSHVMSDKPIEEIVKVSLKNGDDYTLEKVGADMVDYISERSKVLLKERPEITKNFFKFLDEYEHNYVKTVSDRNEYQEYYRAIRILNAAPRFLNREHAPLAQLTNKYEKDKIIPTISDSSVRKKFINDKSIVKYPELKVRGECLGLVLTKARINCHIDMLEAIDFDTLINSVKKKTIVFTSYVKVLEECENRLKALKYKPLVIYGDTNKDLPTIIGNFTKKPELNPLIATFQSLSSAVPITIANHVIMLNNPWRSFEREQAIARAHRLGQDEPVFVTDIILDTGNKQNISSRTLDIMEWSKAQVDKIMGFDSNVNVSLEDHPILVSVESAIVSDILSNIEEEIMFTEPTIQDITPVEPVIPANSNMYELYEMVSMEMSNPFASAGSYTLKKFKEFASSIKNETISFVEKINVNNSPSLFGGIENEEIGKAIIKKKVIYSDMSPLQVYTPTILQSSAKMLDYVNYLNGALDTALNIQKVSAYEVLDVLNVYIGSPGRLGDIMTTPNTANEKVKLTHLEEHSKIFQKLTKSTNTSTQRPFAAAYSRMEDFKLTCKIGSECSGKRMRLVNNMVTFKELVKEVNDRSDRLLFLISTEPEKYTLGNVAGERLSRLLFTFAKEIEFVGATIYNTDSCIKSLYDTVNLLNRAVR